MASSTFPTTNDLLKEVLDNAKKIKDPARRFNALRSAFGGFHGEDLRTLLKAAHDSIKSIDDDSDDARVRRNQLIAQIAPILRQIEVRAQKE